MSQDLKILFIYPNTEMATLVPLNLSLLSPCLKEAGFDVSLFDTTYYNWEDTNFEQKRVELLQLRPFSYKEKGVYYKETDMYEDLVEQVDAYQPDLIAITLVEDTYDLGMSLLAAISHFNVPVVAGGVYVTFAPDEVLANDNVDLVCVGEGEDALVELCQKMSRGEDYASIQNLWLKRDGRVIKNPLRKLKDINTLPFIDYDIFDRKRLYRPMQGKIYTMIHVEIDRGCPYDCTYCGAPHLRRLFFDQGCGVYYRRKDADRVIKEMKFLAAKYNPDYINFNSEAFLAKPFAELKKFAEKYQEIGLPFWCQTRPETVTEEKIRLLKDMGCQNLQFGIEHGNEEFRKKVLNRHYSNKQLLEALRIVEKYSIAYTVNNIIGFPDETRELIFDTIQVNREINPATMNVCLFTPYRGTRLYQYCIEKGYMTKEDKVHQLLDSVPLDMPSITYEELKGLQRTFPLYARLPETMFEQIKAAEKFDPAGDEMYGKLSKIFYDTCFK